VVNVGPLEIVLVAVIALIVLGPQRLPEVARSLGRGMREFRSALNSAGEDRDDYEDDDVEDEHDVPEEPVVEPPPLPREPPGTAAEAEADLPERS
jgi:TatA/E family protein of Tat protein translocase